MTRRLHIVPEASEANGVFQVARMLAVRDGGELRDADGTAYVVDGVALKDPMDWTRFATKKGVGHPVEWFDEVWVHGMWLPCEWAACRMALRAGKRLVRMTHGSLSPIYLEKQGKWKKRLVSPIERHYFAKCDRIAVTGPWEEEWCRKWGLLGPFENIDLKRFFKLESGGVGELRVGELHLLYLGRRHPLKGVEYLEAAVRGLANVDLRIVSDAFGEEKEKVWEWCDVLVLPTLSENFGRVVAEALERGKRVITTNGAPAWGERELGSGGVESGGVEVGYGGRLIYLKGYRDGTDEQRVVLLKNAIERMCS